MSPNQIRREYKTRSSINTRAQNKRLSCNMGIDVHLNQKKRKKSISFVDAAHTQETTFNEDDNMINVKRVKKLDAVFPIEHKSYILCNRNVKDYDEAIDSSSVHMNSNETLGKIQLPVEETINAKINSYAPKLMDSPVTDNHMQHRSTKSPKRSSKNSFPPKTHSISPPKSLRTPAKWTLTIKSPAESQKNDISFKKKRLQVKSRLSDFAVGTRCSLPKHNLPTCFKVASETKNKSKSTSSVSMKQGLRKFSMSPKVVLKFTKTKLISTKASPLKLKKTRGNECFTDSSGETAVQLNERKFVSRKDSDVGKPNVTSTITSTATDVASPTRFISTKSVCALKEPVVVLQRLSHIPFASSSLPLSPLLVKTRINSRFNNSDENASQKIFNSTVGRTRRLLKSNETRHLRAKHNDKNSPVTPSRLQGIGKTAVCPLKKSPQDKAITMDEVDNTSKISSEPLMSSTPRDKRQHSESNDKRKMIGTSQTYDATLESGKRNAVYTQQETTVNVENEQEEVKGKNETYELVEPKTPNLRKKLQEKKSTNKVNSNEKVIKKSLKVRFTSPSSETNCPYGFRLRLSANKKELVNNSSSNIMTRATAKKDVLKSPVYAFRTQSSSVSSGTITPTVVGSFTTSSQTRNKSRCVANLNISSTRPFGPSVKESDPKYSASKKIPNFTKIHRRMFAKSESIVDAKKRLEERHTTLTALKINKSMITKISSKEKNRLPNEPTSNGPYNRFGFKIRKSDAINCIMRKSNLHSIRNKQQQETRAILKGVRTNRRFELQMKARNKNP